MSIYELATAYHKKTYHLVSELIQRLTYPTNYLNNYMVSKIFQLHTSQTENAIWIQRMAPTFYGDWKQFCEKEVFKYRSIK